MKKNSQDLLETINNLKNQILVLQNCKSEVKTIDFKDFNDLKRKSEDKIKLLEKKINITESEYLKINDINDLINEIIKKLEILNLNTIKNDKEIDNIVILINKNKNDSNRLNENLEKDIITHSNSLKEIEFEYKFKIRQINLSKLDNQKKINDLKKSISNLQNKSNEIDYLKYIINKKKNTNNQKKKYKLDSINIIEKINVEKKTHIVKIQNL